MDKTPCYFVIPRSSTIDKKGVQKVKVKTRSAEHLRFTVALIAGVKKMCFLLFASLQYWYVNIWRMFLRVNISLECKLWLPRVESEKVHEERNLREPYLEEKGRWVFQHRKAHYINRLC